MDLQAVYPLVADDMGAVDALIHDRLSSDVVLINQLGHYIVNSGGKRLRPMVLILSARAFDYPGGDHHCLAAVVEFIHTATLLHDDVVDSSVLRRGQGTANSIWGNEASVLVGDFLYSRAFEMMVEVGSMRVMEIMARATNTIAEGEVMQLLNVHEADISEAHYLEVVRSKTAKLFEAAGQLGAVISGAGENMETAMACYGLHLGTAFQLIDDVLDYSGETDKIGKNIGDDLAEGKPTLPLIHSMRYGTPEQSNRVRTAITEGGLEHIEAVHEAIESTGAIQYTARSARREADQALDALEGLPASPYKDALHALAEFSVNRTY